MMERIGSNIKLESGIWKWKRSIINEPNDESERGKVRSGMWRMWPRWQADHGQARRWVTLTDGITIGGTLTKWGKVWGWKRPRYFDFDLQEKMYILAHAGFKNNDGAAPKLPLKGNSEEAFLNKSFLRVRTQLWFHKKSGIALSHVESPKIT